MDKDISLNEYNLSLLQGGPFYSLLVRAGLAQPGLRGIVLRISFLIGITWVSLALITIWQGTFLNSTLKVPFLYDFAEECRFLFVMPILVVAEGIVEPWMAQMLTHCRRLVSDEDAEKFQSFIKAAMRGRDSIVVEALITLLAFVRPHLGDIGLSTSVSSWHSVTTAAGTEPTLAFLWYLFVAKPLVTLLWFRWLWRYIIWSLLLVRISTLALRVMPTHPDRMGGFGFIADGQSKFAILSLAYAAQVAGNIGEEIFFNGATLMSFRYLIIGVAALGLVVFLPPCLAFTPKLLAAKKRGLLEYGALADQYTSSFHGKWIEGKRDDSDALIGSADIQSLADLGNSFQVVSSMRVVVISKATLLSFVIASLIPFAPLLLTAYPLDELLRRLLKVVM